MRGARRLAPRHARVALGALAAAALAVEICRFGIADILAPSEPETATSFDGSHPTAALILGESMLSDDPAAASDEAARLLRRDPLAPGALTLLAAAAARGGEAERAQRMFRVAGAHSPIDYAAHAALYDRAVTSGDGVAALAELDILLRARPSLAERLVAPAGALLALGPAVEQRFVDLLASAPPWRAALLEQMSYRLRDGAVLARVLGGLRATRSPPSLDETRLLLERLLRDGETEQAYLAWLDFLPPERLGDLGLLYNGRFRSPATNLPFDWQLPPVSGAKAHVTQKDGEGTLNVEFYDARVPFAHVRHLLTLSPGDYAFSGVAAADNLQTERGLRWRIACFGGSGAELATTPLLDHAQPPRPFRAAFAVPAEGCGVQLLVLELPARIASEMQISGTARFSRLEIESLRR